MATDFGIEDTNEKEGCYSVVKNTNNESSADVLMTDSKSRMYDEVLKYYEEKNYPEGIKLAERIRDFYAAPLTDAEKRDKSKLLNLLANLYSDNNEPKKAELAYKESFELLHSLTETVSNEADKRDLSLVCNNLAYFYDCNGRPDKAEKLYLEALELFRGFIEKDNESGYEFYAGLSCNNLARIYEEKKMPEEAEKYYLEALKLYHSIKETERNTSCEMEIARTCDNLATFYYGKKVKNKAQALDFMCDYSDTIEDLYLEALDIYREYLGDGQEDYISVISDLCIKLSSLYIDISKNYESEKLLLEAEEILLNLVTPNDYSYDLDLALAQNNLGYLYFFKLQDVEKSINYYKESVKTKFRYRIKKLRRFLK